MHTAIKNSLIERLKKEYQLKKQRNKSYSLRAFSRFLSIDPSNLSKIMNGQLTPGNKLKEKLAHKLGINSKIILNSPSYRNTDDSVYSDHALDIFSIISDWHHYALLEIIKLKKYRNKFNKASIAKDLGISMTEFNAAVARLINHGLLKLNSKSGKMENNSESSSSILNVNTSTAHRNQQKQILEKAIDALETIPPEKRSQSSMTFALDRKKLPMATQMIKEFRRELAAFLSDSNNLDDVYHLSISLYPTTSIHKQQGEKK